MSDPDAAVHSGGRVAGHYQGVLARHYTWMLGGDIERTAAGQRELLGGLLPAPDGVNRTAVDLGCGSGAQTLALADLGYDPVLAIDPDPALLHELRTHVGDRPAVQTRQADAVAALGGLDPASVAVCVCMGDTLLHLPTAAAVVDLFAETARTLRPGGTLLLTYRDLTGHLAGTDRFIPVRSDDQRIMLCFLDVADPDVLEVHDIVYTRGEDGWTMTAGSYPKLRLSPEWVRRHLDAAGLDVDHHEPGPSGMWRTLARRPTMPTP